MDVLIVGGGGREHAMAWSVAKSPQVDRVYVAPGNAGTALENGVENIPLSSDDIDALLEFALHRNIGLTIIGPEAPLVAGIVDRFTVAGLACLVRQKPPPSLKAPRLLPRTLWPATVSRQPHMETLPT